jgi:hypothetical protein
LGYDANILLPLPAESLNIQLPSGEPDIEIYNDVYGQIGIRAFLCRFSKNGGNSAS